MAEGWDAVVVEGDGLAVVVVGVMGAAKPVCLGCVMTGVLRDEWSPQLRLIYRSVTVSDGRYRIWGSTSSVSAKAV